MKKKILSKSTRGISRLTANLDGKYVGLTQIEVETAMAHLTVLEIACIQGNYRSLLLAMRKNAVRKAKSIFKNAKK